MSGFWSPGRHRSPHTVKERPPKAGQPRRVGVVYSSAQAIKHGTGKKKNRPGEKPIIYRGENAREKPRWNKKLKGTAEKGEDSTENEDNKEHNECLGKLSLGWARYFRIRLSFSVFHDWERSRPTVRTFL